MSNWSPRRLEEMKERQTEEIMDENFQNWWKTWVTLWGSIVYHVVFFFKATFKAMIRYTNIKQFMIRHCIIPKIKIY